MRLICGQLCGLGHYSMKGTLVVDTPEDYQAWLKERAELAGTQTAPDPLQRPAGEPHAGPNQGTCSAAGRAEGRRSAGQPATRRHSADGAHRPALT